jgi:hypothetical protein
MQASSSELKEIMIEVILFRARKSLEHLKRHIEIYYKEIFEPWFVTGEDRQAN